MASDATRMLNGKVAVSCRVPVASVSGLCQVDDRKKTGDTCSSSEVAPSPGKTKGMAVASEGRLSTCLA